MDPTKVTEITALYAVVTVDDENREMVVWDTEFRRPAITDDLEFAQLLLREAREKGYLRDAVLVRFLREEVR